MRVGIHNNAGETGGKIPGLDFYNEEELDDLPVENPYIRKQPADATVDTEIELESRFITPKAEIEFPELTRDLRASNLSAWDVDMSMRVGEILRYLDVIEASYFKKGALDKSRSMFVSDLHYTANTRAAFKGFIAQLMRTQRMENIPTTEIKETYEPSSSQNPLAILKALRRGKKPERIV